MFPRIVTLPNNYSFFLFGPRGCGKTTLIQTRFTEHTHFIDLLNLDLQAAYQDRPERLREELEDLPQSVRTIVIDEIQKVPELLDVVHRQIETGPRTFVLTGSSARKLKRGASNLLAGRAFIVHLFPLTAQELAKEFNLQSALEYGTLPNIFTLSDVYKKKYLRAYAHSYLREEVWQEQLIRNLSPFRKFLEIAAQSHGQVINYSKIARDIGVDHKTVANYYSILEDTLLGVLLPAFHGSVRKQQRQSPKFYLFDNGVKRALDKTLDIPLKPASFEYGTAFEALVIREIMTYAGYLELDYSFSYIRAESGAEVDLIIERPGRPTVLAEIKSSAVIKPQDLRHLRLFAPDFKDAELYCLCNEKQSRRMDGIRVIAWQEGVRQIVEAQT